MRRRKLQLRLDVLGLRGNANMHSLASSANQASLYGQEDALDHVLLFALRGENEGKGAVDGDCIMVRTIGFKMGLDMESTLLNTNFPRALGYSRLLRLK